MLAFNKPRHAQFGFLALIIFALSIYWFAPISKSSLAPYLKAPTSSTLPASKIKQTNIEIEGLTIGKPFDKIHPDLTGKGKLRAVTDALLNRFSALDVNVDHPQCPIDLTRYDAVLSSSSFSTAETSRRVSLALNLYNSQDILPSLSVALLELVHYLKPSHKVYISIFENDSTDKTLELLGDLAAALVALDIDGLTFRHSILSRPGSVERISGLANIRNEALYPLYANAEDGMLLFVNDVVTCSSDLLELLYQLRLQKAHGAMSTDWFINRDNDGEQPQFRDIWVMRGINGELPYPYSSPGGYTPTSPTGNWVKDLFVTQNEEVHQRWIDGRAVPVYSGWNGAMAFDAKLFTEYHMRFRASGAASWTGGDSSGGLGKWGQLIATPGYLESDCSASECKYVIFPTKSFACDPSANFAIPDSLPETYGI